MEDELFDKLDNLNIEDTNLLLNEEIQLQLNISTRKRIERSVKIKAGYYTGNNTFKDKVNNIIEGIIMKRKIALALSGALLLSLGGGGYAYAKTTPVAYVSLDINPSVELGVNTFDQVTSAEAYNEDGQKVLEGTNLINSDVDKAVSTVISNAITDGYVKEDGSSGIEITTSSDKENVANKLDESLKEVANKTLENNNKEATVETEKVALQRRDEARKLGITPGKLNLIQKLQELNPTIKVEDYKSSSVKDIMKKTKELREGNKQDQDDTTVDQNNSTNATTGQSNSTDTTIDSNNQQQTLPQISADSDKSSIIKEGENNATFYTKDNNWKKEDDEKDVGATTEKKNNGSVNSQENNNYSKSEHNDKRNGNSENKGKNK